jgi:hypothetical protein
MPAKTYSIGPGAIADPGTQGGPAFNLSKPEWIAIQNYVNDGLSLPTTINQFRNQLGSGAPADLSDFNKLIAAYVAVNQHCTGWRTSIFPNTVALAMDVAEYGLETVPVYYPAMVEEADAVATSLGNNTAAVTALETILGYLQQTVSGYAAKAKANSDAIKLFAEQMQADQNSLVGAPAAPGLQQYYSAKYGQTSAEVAQFNQQLVGYRLALSGDQAEYRHDCIVAATSPSYSWVWPFGTIAAAVVAGEYGHKAVEAMNRMQDDQNNIARTSAQLAADANLISALTLATGGIGNISAALADALPAVQKIQGVWQGISDDIAAIVTMIGTDIMQVPPIIMNLGIGEAITAWSNVAHAANTYRLNAYVASSGGALASMEAWKVRNLIASPKNRAA